MTAPAAALVDAPTVADQTLSDAGLPDRLVAFVDAVAGLAEVKAAVEANHDDNRWWPTSITDPRLRMTVAGWSTRVSYAMIGTYSRVVLHADRIGYDALTGMTDADLAALVHPLGLPAARIAYLRSLSRFLRQQGPGAVGDADADTLIGRFAASVDQASYKVAQCAVLYARGYHCGVIPVDSGMVTKLAPALGIRLPKGPIAHERMRLRLQACVTGQPGGFRELVGRHAHQVTIPAGVLPTWWVHLVLIYAKRALFNRPDPRLCPDRPVCAQVVDCPHAAAPALTLATG